MSAVFEVVVANDVTEFSCEEIFWLDEKLLWTSGYSNRNVRGGVGTRLKIKFDTKVQVVQAYIEVYDVLNCSHLRSSLIMKYLKEILVGSDILGVEPHRGGDGAGDPVYHDVVQQLVQSELLR